MYDDHLNMASTRLLNIQAASAMIQQLEDQVRYILPEQSQVMIRGEWRNIPREVAGYGDAHHLQLQFSGTVINAQVWLPVLLNLRDAVASRTGETFNFAVVNRFADGKCGIGTHKEGQGSQDGTFVIVTLGDMRYITFTREHAR